MLFAGDNEGNFVWMVRIQKNVTEPSEPDDPTTPEEPNNQDTPSEPSEPGNQTTPSEPNIPSTQESVKIDISVNELDVTSLSIGMEAEVKINALGGEKFSATITDISNTGENNGGYSYFTVELTMDRGTNVLVGMNATATIITATTDEILTIPVDALVENGTKTVVYTDYDEEKNELLNPVTVTIGASDGQVAEVIEGLEEEETYYYAYYDTLDISFVPDFGGEFGRFSFGR